MARVSGTLSRKVVPWPGMLRTLMVPLRRSMTALTTSMPTPRPLISVTSLEVLRPAWKMRSRASLSLMRAACSGLRMALGDRLLDDHREIDAVAVIADLDDHLVALMIGIEADGSFGRFTGGSALQRRLDPVIDGVAQQVHHGLGQRVQNALVEVGILALDDDVDLAAGLFGGVTHHPGQTAEHLLDGHHANLHYGALQFSENLRLEGENVGGPGAQRTVREAAIHLREKFLHHAFGDDEFAHQIEHHVDALGLDPDDVFGGGGKAFFADLGTLLRLTHGLRGASLVLLPLRDVGLGAVPAPLGA